jgi:phosphatidylserine/phosphatidylglycerophosphate/cardiolipin synthase-like enzyme
MIGAIAIVIILLVASIPKVPVSQQYVTTTQTQSFTTTQFQTITQTVPISGPSPLVEYCFTSGYGSTSNCASLVIYWIGHANSSIHILIYSFTLSAITSALAQAKARGVDVKIVMDPGQVTSNGPSSQYTALKNANLDVRLGKGMNEMHDKVAIIDSAYILTGSFNWSQNANSNNDENLIVLRDQAWAQAYEAEFTLIWNKAA